MIFKQSLVTILQLHEKILDKFFSMSNKYTLNGKNLEYKFRYR